MNDSILRSMSICLLSVLLAMQSYAANKIEEDALLNMLHEEVTSHYAKFSSNDLPVNYIGVTVHDVRTFDIGSRLGAIDYKTHDNKYQFAVNVKIGTPESKYFKWMIGDRSYSASNPFFGNLAQLRLAVANKIETVHTGMLKNPKAFRIGTDSIADVKGLTYYSDPTPKRYKEASLPDRTIDMEAWESVLNEVSSVFRSNEYVINAAIQLHCTMGRRFFVSSDGGEIVSNNHSYTLTIFSDIVNSKGEKCPLGIAFSATKMEDLPSKEKLIQIAKELLTHLHRLYGAPRIEAFEGPVLFGGVATGLLMHEMIGHRVESSKYPFDLMLKKLNSRLFADCIQIYDDPTVEQYTGIPLVGHYLYDDEGVPSQKVEYIKNGTLVSLLTSRTPVYKGSVSNGHGRGTLENEPMARQSNLFVSSSTPYSESQLREMFVTEIKRQRKEYGYYIPSLSDGKSVAQPLQLKLVSDSLPDFAITLDHAYRVYADGRPDELVSGGTLISSPQAIIRSIIGMGTECEVNNGTCGAKSGEIPVALIAPKMCVSNMKWTLPISKGIRRVPPPLPAIQELRFKDEHATILNALGDEMTVVKSNMKGDETSGLRFADYTVNNYIQKSYAFSKGQCADSSEKKEVKAGVRLYWGDKDSVIVASDSPINLGFSLPLESDYFVIRSILRDKTIAAYNNALNKRSTDGGLLPGNPILRELPAAKHIDLQSSCVLSDMQLRDIAYKLSLEMNKHRDFKNSFVRVGQNQNNDYRVTSEGQTILKQQVFLDVFSRADVIMKDGSTKQEMMTLHCLAAEASSVIKAFNRKMKETLKYLKERNPEIEPDSSFVYEGPVLVEAQSVKNLLVNELDDCLIDRFMKKDTKTIGDTVLDKRFSICQQADAPFYKGRKLWGYEEFDMDGVKPESMVLVENGILRHKLGGRLSLSGSTHSTGNERINGSKTITHIGVVHITSSDVQKYKAIKSAFIRTARAAGQKYAYILREDEQEGEESIFRVDTDTQEEVRLECNFQAFPRNALLTAVSQEESLIQERNGTPCSYILPRAILYGRFKLQISRKKLY